MTIIIMLFWERALAVVSLLLRGSHSSNGTNSRHPLHYDVDFLVHELAFGSDATHRLLHVKK